MIVAHTPLERFPAEVYDRLVRDTLLGSRGFLDLWRSGGGRPVVWSAEQDGRVAALLPGVEFGVFPLGRFCCLPDGCYGGLFVDPAAAFQRPRFAETLLGAVACSGYSRAHLFDLQGRLPLHPAFRVTHDETHLVDISDPAWLPADAGLRSQARKAVREGLRVEPFRPERHLERFLTLSAETYRRRGLPPRYGPRFFAALATLAAQEPRVVWRWCEWEGHAVCSHLYFIEGDTLQAWQSYFDKSFSFLKPNPAIRVATCHEAARRGVHWLNLGATPAGAPGLEYFKSRWGGRRVRATSLVHMTALGALAERWRGRHPGSGPTAEDLRIPAGTVGAVKPTR